MEKKAVTILKDYVSIYLRWADESHRKAQYALMKKDIKLADFHTQENLRHLDNAKKYQDAIDEL